MKRTFYYFLFLLLSSSTFLACSSDEVTPENKAEEVKIALFEENIKVEAPEALMNSNNSYATKVVNALKSVNEFTQYSTYFVPPADAKRSNTPIVAANARLAATAYYVYEWSHNGYNIAYQISEHDTKYVFELFWKGPDDKQYLRYFYGEQTKDGKSGVFKMYNIYDTNNNFGDVIASWEWQKFSDGSLKFVYDFSGYIRYELNVNADKSGEITYFISGEKHSYMSWDKHGNGLYQSYENGEVVEENTWTVN